MLNKAKSLSYIVGQGFFDWVAGNVFQRSTKHDGKTKSQNVQGQRCSRDCICSHTQIGSATWVSANCWSSTPLALDVSLPAVSEIQPTYVLFWGQLVRASQLLGSTRLFSPKPNKHNLLS